MSDTNKPCAFCGGPGHKYSELDGLWCCREAWHGETCKKPINDIRPPDIEKEKKAMSDTTPTPDTPTPITDEVWRFKDESDKRGSIVLDDERYRVSEKLERELNVANAENGRLKDSLMRVRQSYLCECPACDGRGVDDYGESCIRCGGQMDITVETIEENAETISELQEELGKARSEIEWLKRGGGCRA